MNITDVSGIGDATAQRLKAHGIDSVEAVAAAKIEQLAAVPGIGPRRAAVLRESALRMLPDTTAGAESPDAVPAPVAGDAEAGLEVAAETAGDDAKAKRTKGGKRKKKEKKGKKKDGKKGGKGGKKKGKKDKGGGKKKRNRRK